MDIVSVCKLAGIADDGDDEKSVRGHDAGGGDDNIRPNAEVPSVPDDEDVVMADGTDPPEGLADHK